MLPRANFGKPSMVVGFYTSESSGTGWLAYKNYFSSPIPRAAARLATTLRDWASMLALESAISWSV